MNDENSRVPKVEGRAPESGAMEAVPPSTLDSRLSTSYDPRLISPGRQAWQRFKNNRAAVISAVYLAVLLVLVVAWPLA